MIKMHKDEFEIDEFIVKKLLEEQFPFLSNLPLKKVPSAGTDNALYTLGEDKVIRLPKIDWAVDSINKEYEWLPKVAPFLPFKIPQPIYKGNPTSYYPWPWFISNWIEGSNPSVNQLPNSNEWIDDLILFIEKLHEINITNGPPSQRGIPLKKRDLETRKAIKQLEGIIDTESITLLWETFLKIADWDKPPVWVHGDLSPGNLLLYKERLNAVIDFGLMGIGDPACDLIIAWNLLPKHSRSYFKSKLSVDENTWQRGRGWALSNSLIVLPYYKNTNAFLVKNAEHTIQEILNEKEKVFHFTQARPSQLSLIENWLSQPHIRKWLHGEGLENTLQGLKKFFQNNQEWVFWIGYKDSVPFAFLITSLEGDEAITLDIFICDLNYLGKGLAVPMIKEFLLHHFPEKKKVLIDPECTNERAIHVYEKVGFRIIDKFIASWNPVPHFQMELNMKDIFNK